MDEKVSPMVESYGRAQAKGSWSGGRSGAKSTRNSVYVLDEDQLTQKTNSVETPPSSKVGSLNVPSAGKSPLPPVSENGDNVFSPISPAGSNTSMSSAGGSKSSRRSSVAGESKTNREERYKKAIDADPTDANALSKYGVLMILYFICDFLLIIYSFSIFLVDFSKEYQK